MSGLERPEGWIICQNLLNQSVNTLIYISVSMQIFHLFLFHPFVLQHNINTWDPPIFLDHWNVLFESSTSSNGTFALPFVVATLAAISLIRSLPFSPPFPSSRKPRCSETCSRLMLGGFFSFPEHISDDKSKHLH